MFAIILLFYISILLRLGVESYEASHLLQEEVVVVFSLLAEVGPNKSCQLQVNPIEL